MNNVVDLKIEITDFCNRRALTLDAAGDTEAISLAEARELMIGRCDDGHPHPDMVSRWCAPHNGYRACGLIVVLPSIKLGGRRWTTKRWVRAFENERRRLGSPPEVRREEMPRPTRQRAAAIARADAALQAAGI